MRKKSLIFLFLIGSLCAVWSSCKVGSRSCRDQNDCVGPNVCRNGICIPSNHSIHVEKPASSEPVDKEQAPSDAGTVESQGCKTGDTQICGVSKGECKEGKRICVKGEWGECQGQVLPKPEVCDTKDNDCDGQVDEDFSNKGKSCRVGIGECASEGKWICQKDKLVCDATPKAPQKEICDKKDNDCNGKVDEVASCKTRQGKFLLSSGGNASSSSKYRLTGTLGPALLNNRKEMSSGKYKLKGGFLLRKKQ